MFKALPLTLLLLLAFVAYKSFEQVQEKNSAQKEESATLATATPSEIAQLEPASSGAEKKEPVDEALKEKVEEEHKADEDGKKALPAYVSRTRPEEKIPELTKAEKELLQQMSARRLELEEWEKQLDMRASMMEASSRKLDDKIAKLENLKNVTEKLIAEYKAIDDAKIKSMVKIYENMKPKDAAAVFDKLEMPVLLEIVEQMSERRVAPILAKMDGKKATEVTEKILKDRDLAKASGVN